MMKKENKLTIFLDMDGVVNDWLTPACKLCNVDLSNKDIREHFKKGLDLNEFVPEEEIWRLVNEAGSDFWLNLELYPWANKLFDCLYNMGHEFSFLTSPGKHSAIPCTPKVQYIKKHFNTHKIILAHEKWHCAGFNKILIDDSKKNTNLFREAGGQAFDWPHQYQLKDDNNVDEVIDSLVSQIRDMEN